MALWHDSKKRPVSYFEILNVSPDANDDAVKQAYRRLAIKFHPDQNPQSRTMAEHRFRLISEAYAQIKTQSQRNKYKEKLNASKLQAANQNAATHAEKSSNVFSQIAEFFGLPASSSTPKSKTGKG